MQAPSRVIALATATLATLCGNACTRHVMKPEAQSVTLAAKEAADRFVRKNEAASNTFKLNIHEDRGPRRRDMGDLQVVAPRLHHNESRHHHGRLQQENWRDAMGDAVDLAERVIRKLTHYPAG
jgi:hypothetical protein